MATASMHSTMSGTLRAAEREVRFFTLTWKGTVFTTLVAPILLLVAMGVGLGELVDDDTGSLDGQDYLSFVTPGLLVATVAQTASGYSLWPIMAGHKWLGFHRAMVSTPLAPTDVLSGLLLWQAARAMASGLVFVLVGALLGGVASAWGILCVPVAGLTALAFAAPLSAYSARCDSDQAFDPLLRIVVTPLFLFSGTFFPISELPALLAFVAQLFPLYHGAELARATAAGSADWDRLAVHLAVLAVYIGGGRWWGARTFTQRLTP